MGTKFSWTNGLIALVLLVLVGVGLYYVVTKEGMRFDNSMYGQQVPSVPVRTKYFNTVTSNSESLGCDGRTNDFGCNELANLDARLMNSGMDSKKLLCEQYEDDKKSYLQCLHYMYQEQ